MDSQEKKVLKAKPVLLDVEAKREIKVTKAKPLSKFEIARVSDNSSGFL